MKSDFFSFKKVAFFILYFHIINVCYVAINIYERRREYG